MFEVCNAGRNIHQWNCPWDRASCNFQMGLSSINVVLILTNINTLMHCAPGIDLKVCRRRIFRDATATAIHGANRHNCQVRTWIYGRHFARLYLPIVRIILNNAQRVNPKKPNSKSPGDYYSMLKCLWELFHFDLTKSFWQVCCNCFTWVDVTPSMTECHVGCGEPSIRFDQPNSGVVELGLQI